MRDLLRAPPLQPPAIPAMWLVPALPLGTLRPNRPTIGTTYNTRQSVLHVLAEPAVRGQPGRLRPADPPLGVPLRDRRLVLEPQVRVDALRRSSREIVDGL